ncbi:unnamed protein product [Vicia faba]|uniref:GATA-type domain-containing protein n=1 Tax=Vicia faba TaxID=3906 RepID=A0AAV0YUE1_VICFA|nr:unnamed protein product [Vicia faba]
MLVRRLCFPFCYAIKAAGCIVTLGRPRDTQYSPLPHFLLPLNYHHISGINDPSRNSKLSRRFASLVRFREKRKDRCFQKKIHYTCRKEVAERMQRKNGQFASLKEEYNSPTENQDSSSGTPCPKSTERRCQHCETGEKSTPVMRRGPAGPRSLCNACGLMSLESSSTATTTTISAFHAFAICLTSFGTKLACE